MGTIVGVDGCKGGWLSAEDRDGVLTLNVFRTFGSLLHTFSDAAVIAVDIPIGLACGPRPCDLAARKELPGRTSCVFPAPCRHTFRAADRLAAANAMFACHGKKVTAQGFGILAKIEEVDSVMTPALQGVIREIHPELSFTRMQGNPMTTKKARVRGFADRHAALATALPDVRILPRLAYQHLFGTTATPDDVLDASAALWTAKRIALGAAECIPAGPQVDSRGLRMEMWV